MTRKIKLITTSSDLSYNNDDYDRRVISEGMTEWEEVTEEEYKFLILNQWQLQDAIGIDKQVIILEYSPSVTAKTTIAVIKERIEKKNEEYRKKAERRDADAKRKKEAAAKKKAEKLAESTDVLDSILNNPELLEKLKVKLETQPVKE